MIGGRIIAVLSLVLSPVLTIPSLYQPRANWTGYIQPKQEIRARDSLPAGYHVLAVGEWASVTSPGYPGKYNNNADLHWKIDVADWKTGYLDVWCHNHMFHIRGSRNCNADRLTIYYTNFKQRYCENKKPPGYFRTTQNWIDFHFKSDGSGNAAGFLCQIRAMGSPANAPFEPSYCSNCGQANTNRVVGGENTNRIVNGIPSGMNEYPWLAALVIHGEFQPGCGGSLYNKEWVITAAHCVTKLEGGRLIISDTSSTDVLLGMYNWATKVPEPTRHTLSQIIPHPRYTGKWMDSDIALVKLSSPATYNNRIRPVCLPMSNVNFAGSISHTTGWGLQAWEGSYPYMAQKIVMPIASKQDCFKAHGSNYFTDNMICAGTPDQAICPGDSGGPMTVEMSNQHYLAGVVSWGPRCATGPYFSVYTDVTKFIGFITSVAGAQCG